VGRRDELLHLLAGEDVGGDEVALGVTVLAGLGGGHFHDFAGTALFLGEKNNHVLLLL
jgi:hypothetical protein